MKKPTEKKQNNKNKKANQKQPKIKVPKQK
jgi:hypothetical protein